MLYSMAHFGTVAVLGIEMIYNIPTLIYQRIHQSNSFDSIRTGTVLATVLVVTAAFIIWLQGKILSKGNYQIIEQEKLPSHGTEIAYIMACAAILSFALAILRLRLSCRQQSSSLCAQLGRWTLFVETDTRRRTLPNHWAPVFACKEAPKGAQGRTPE